MATNLLRFSEVSEVIAAETTVEIDLEDIVFRRGNQLVRWRYFGEEILRRLDWRTVPVPN
jgi:hypothetical protein